MDLILNKLLFISKLNSLKNNLIKYEKVKGEVKRNYELDENNINFVKIDVECNAFDVNEDKQRQCYKQLKCFWPKCRYRCEYVGILNEHISLHLNKRQFVCNECNKQFNNNSIFINHKRTVHSNVRPFICHRKDCNKTFKTKNHLKNHLSTHSSIERFECGKCDKRFKTREGSRNHINVHKNIRPFVCQRIDCKKVLKQRQTSFYTNQYILTNHSNVKNVTNYLNINLIQFHINVLRLNKGNSNAISKDVIKNLKLNTS